VFFIRGESLQSMPVRSMREGFFGRTLEDALQTLIEKYPEVIPGSMIEPGAEDPPRFVLLRREMPAGGWSLDHLLVDQRGILTLVEAKLIQNPDSRRDVVGQIMEYAAVAVESWTAESVHEKAGEFWAKSNMDVDSVIRDAFGEDKDPDEFWSSVAANLAKGRIRLIIAGDEIRPEVRRIIEYLNAEMANAEVLGLELKCYGLDSESLVLVPRLVGQTQAVSDRKSGDRPSKSWSIEELRSIFSDSEDVELGKRLREVLDWAVDKDRFLLTYAMGPAFGIRGEGGNRLMTIYSGGGAYCYIANIEKEKGSTWRDDFVKRLKQMNLFDMNLNAAEVVSGRNLSRRIEELGEGEFKEWEDAVFGMCT
jgi:hypothetical protein